MEIQRAKDALNGWQPKGRLPGPIPRRRRASGCRFCSCAKARRKDAAIIVRAGLPFIRMGRSRRPQDLDAWLASNRCEVVMDASCAPSPLGLFSVVAPRKRQYSGQPSPESDGILCPGIRPTGCCKPVSMLGLWMAPVRPRAAAGCGFQFRQFPAPIAGSF